MFRTITMARITMFYSLSSYVLLLHIYFDLTSIIQTETILSILNLMKIYLKYNHNNLKHNHNN